MRVALVPRFDPPCFYPRACSLVLILFLLLLVATVIVLLRFPLELANSVTRSFFQAVIRFFRPLPSYFRSCPFVPAPVLLRFVRFFFLAGPFFL